jgi:hypothetical protein
MAKDYDTIINEINNHISISGKRYYSDFYVGITKNVEQRLFGDHNVSRDNSWWIYRIAETEEIARAVEKHYLDLGMRGGSGGGDDDSNIVYCYVVTPTTIE